MHSRLEEYLAEVAARLGPLPTQARAEELREMRAHLEAAFAAGLERGQSEDEAARGVLAQFGTPEAVCADTLAAWRRGVTLRRRDFWGAAACVLALLFLLPRLLDPPVLVYYRPLTPLLVGGMSGWLFPRRAAAGTALAMLGVAVVIAVEVTYFISHAAHTWPSAVLSREALMLASWSAVGSLLAIGAAWAGSRWRRRGGQRPHAA